MANAKKRRKVDEAEAATLAGPAPFDDLSPREIQVAKLLAIGNPNRTIAAQLDVSIKTIDTHRLRILKKLRAANNVVLARLAIRDGIVDPLPPVVDEGHK